jgi:hypothetical protein
MYFKNQGHNTNREKMALGGRPKEEEGHSTKRFTLNQEACKGLDKIVKGERSKFIEKAVCPVLRQLDPGESCETLGLVDRVLDCEIESASSKGNYEKAAALATLANSLAPYRNLCRVSDGDDAEGNANRESRTFEGYKKISCRKIRSLRR